MSTNDFLDFFKEYVI